MNVGGEHGDAIAERLRFVVAILDCGAFRAHALFRERNFVVHDDLRASRLS